MNTNRILGSSASGRALSQLVALVLTGLFLTACGQKGPLYLPAPDTPAASTENTEASEGETLKDDEEPIKQR
ncbi:lipoprotein [Hydrogenophaga sp. 5NK40-0174]|uniref:LPS translocon maturation chaperone LptM n=1 Tax=Hydrogenophaga sp. 5NK40-0174 TaxID=3127649 RepID=UPI0031083FB1